MVRVELATALHGSAVVDSGEAERRGDSSAQLATGQMLPPQVCAPMVRLSMFPRRS